ncbi:MAG: helix-turn-helix domain-containing protein [Gammaproteobacteria bacterium]|nr:MAG: helix-turn-helix domain-containing protein [Gammaproteobacteria bacterium]
MTFRFGIVSISPMVLDLDTAALLLDELGNQTRLRIVRLLVRAGDEGRTVGDIQRHIGIPASTLSHHLSHLRSAGVVWQEREGTLLHCFVDFKMITDLVDFLTAECCADKSKARVSRRAAG